MNMKTHSMSLENMPVSSSIICRMFTKKEQAFEACNISILQQCIYLFIQFIKCDVSQHKYRLSGDLTRALRSFAEVLSSMNNCQLVRIWWCRHFLQACWRPSYLTLEEVVVRGLLSPQENY